MQDHLVLENVHGNGLFLVTRNSGWTFAGRQWSSNLVRYILTIPNVLRIIINSDGILSINEFTDHFRYIFDGINTLQGLWVFIIFVCKQNVINLMLVTAGMRESERSKAKSRTTNMQVTFYLFALTVEVNHIFGGSDIIGMIYLMFIRQCW